MTRLWSILIGYVLGNLLGAMLIGRFIFHQDPTKVGSGNPGTANVGAVFGKKWGIITCLGDFLKTAVALLIVASLFPGRVNLAYTALGLILGHCFPILNKFQGGKGVAVAGLFALIYDFPAGVTTLLIALILVIIMKNLTVPPLVFIFLFSCYELTKIREVGIILLVIALIMTFKFRHDLHDFFVGKGKEVDVLYTIKKKLGIKVQ
ncbi:MULTISPECIES: glycerol-3-phosphate acyltransferase [unclassified Lactobacillus]|uniref:glycerol-3-phosphate acyltransferase n=1 Tax=unclassified Lactobacillus TaxID=2620435 RepID=UPI0023F935E8|nr:MULTISPECIES: glycerol-3-phosphate acyltransferase [unclassified Lactobacillus]MDF7668850.1 glycerol-3-phosphate acyltransferase [Lactobacillus sp. ESL0703]WEV38455.1 glycerol-3-phosphate acyltransferase [Lactobacillus sp. ESL0680]